MGVLLPGYRFWWQIEWYQPPIGIFFVCGEINKIISKNIQKIGNFYAIFERTSKKVIKTKFPGWGVLFSGYRFSWQIEWWYQPPICFFSVCGEIDKMISKNIQKSRKFLFLFCVWRKWKNNFRNWQNNFKKIQKLGNFYVIFEITSKKVIKTKFPG